MASSRSKTRAGQTRRAHLLLMDIIRPSRRPFRKHFKPCGDHRSASVIPQPPAVCRRRRRRPRRCCFRRSRSVRSSSSSAPGCRRWCRGAPPTTASSPTTSSTGTAASRAARPASSSSRPPASATCRAGRSCASATTASCPACGAWSKAVRSASGGRTRLFIQLIDFLAVRRRPEAKKFFERFLAITDRAPRRAWAMRRCSDAAVRERLRALDEDELKRVLDAAGVGSAALRLPRARHRRGAAAHPRAAAGAARPLRRGRRARGRRGLRRRRAALRPRLHDGVVPLAHEHARRRLRRHARTSGCGCRSRCSPRCGAP